MIDLIVDVFGIILGAPFAVLVLFAVASLFVGKGPDDFGSLVVAAFAAPVVFVVVVIYLATDSWGHEYPLDVESFIDADTFEADLDIGFELVMNDRRFRLYCINAPESRGARKSEDGVKLSQAVKDLGIERGEVEVVGTDVFGRLLVWFTPEGWGELTLNEWLFRNGAPLYARLTRAERALCEARLGLAQ